MAVLEVEIDTEPALSSLRSEARVRFKLLDDARVFFFPPLLELEVLATESLVEVCSTTEAKLRRQFEVSAMEMPLLTNT